MSAVCKQKENNICEQASKTTIVDFILHEWQATIYQKFLMENCCIYVTYVKYILTQNKIDCTWLEENC